MTLDAYPLWGISRGEQVICYLPMDRGIDSRGEYIHVRSYLNSQGHSLGLL